MPKLEIGQQWEATEIDADIRAAECKVWAFQIVFIAKHKGRNVGLGLKLDWTTRKPIIDDYPIMQCWWFKENGASFGEESVEYRLVRRLGSNDRALRAPRLSDD